MAQSRRAGQAVVVRQTVELEVRRVDFKRAPSVAYLDVTKLSRARKAEFEVGHAVAGGATRTVYAIVRKGMVVGLRMEQCAECTPLDATPELIKAFEAARRKIDPAGGRPSRPVPVAEFLARPFEPERSHCWMFCIFGFCIICCWCCSAANAVTLGGCTILRGARATRSKQS